MHSMKAYFLGGLFALFLQVALGQQRVEIDTWEDLVSTSGWSVECSNGYQQNLSGFQCGFLVRIEIPAEELDGEEGFWTGCGSICDLKYTLRDTDAAFSVRVYLKNANMIVIKNDIVNEYHPGTGWTTVEVDLSFTKTIGLRLVQATTASFAVLDKIFIDPVIPTTTTTSTTTTTPTTTTPTTTPTTTTPTTTPTTTTPTTTPTTTTPTTTPTTTTPTTTIPITTPTTTTSTFTDETTTEANMGMEYDYFPYLRNLFLH